MIPTISYTDTSLTTFDERDRIHVGLYDDKDGSELFELWDEDVSSALEDGFIRVGRKSLRTLSDDDEVLHRSLYDYAVELGAVKQPKE